MASSKIFPSATLGGSLVGVCVVQVSQAWPNQEVVAC